MDQYGEIYPEYGFAQHKGYGTPVHLEALFRCGPCPIHRHSFLQSIREELANCGYKIEDRVDHANRALADDHRQIELDLGEP